MELGNEKSDGDTMCTGNKSHDLTRNGIRLQFIARRYIIIDKHMALELFARK